MPSAEKDKAYLEAGIPEMGDYLLSKELYWPISTRGYDLPRLTIGGILLAQARLEARRERIESFVAQLDGVRLKWRVAWEAKAGREVGARMRLWSNYLADYRQNPESHADAYPHEVRYRVMLHLLLAELPAPPPEQGALSQSDGLLRAKLTASEFIWESDLQTGFPRDVYWYLYGKLVT
jgi:hypothetical protein